MRQFSRTWWGKRFIDALEDFTDEARLGRGRSYARGGKILNYQMDKGKITATVRGSINPYFGVYKEPRYETFIEVSPIPHAKWPKVIKHIASKAGFVAKLLMNEIPDNIETVFSDLSLHLLPHSDKDLTTECSCPDWANPCKHIAGVYYLVASELDHDPFLLFELRGLSKEEIQKELIKTPLGKILSEELTMQEIHIEKSDRFYTEPVKEDIRAAVDLKEFWRGKKRLSKAIEPGSKASVPAVLIKKQGDFPSFWEKDISFIDIMEQIYSRVRTKNKNVM